MSSYAHDAEVIVFNYVLRATEMDTFGTTVGGKQVDVMDTESVSLREAITSIQVSKTKQQPQGTFMITLKPTKEWTKILVPGSWCAIWMSDKPLKESDLTNVATLDDIGNAYCPLKMVGVIMSVRVQKQRDSNGAYALTYSISGYDFGYVFTSSIYINHMFQADVLAGKLQGAMMELGYSHDKEAYGDPVENVGRVLAAWSIMATKPSLVFAAGSLDVKPPKTRMEIPAKAAWLLGRGGSGTGLGSTGLDVLEFIDTAIGVDKRKNKVVDIKDTDTPEFIPKLLGEKFFMVWQLIVNNTLWGMINQYLNPLMNEAYCDLHVTWKKPGLMTPGSFVVTPMLIVRQIPFNTPDFDKYWDIMPKEAGEKTPEKYNVTNLVELPKTILTEEKVLSYEIGYSDYTRYNFIELNGFDIDIDKHSFGAFNNVNRPQFLEGSIRRSGLRPKVEFGVDYGVVRGNISETGYWTAVVMDWWFNSNRYANGTIECIGLLHHIAVGENIMLAKEKILGHIEAYTHSFIVDANGERTFRTSIEFSRGVSSDSTSTMFKYVYGDTNFGGEEMVSINPSAGFPPAGTEQYQESSIFEDDVRERVTYTELKPLQKDTPPVPLELPSIEEMMK